MLAAVVLAAAGVGAQAPVRETPVPPATTTAPDQPPAQAPDQPPAQAPGQPPAQPTPSVAVGPPAPAPGARVFGAPAGLILNAIRPDAVADFERVLGRLAEALAASPDPVRRRQAAGWRVFRATEAGPGDSVLFVFLVDPVVPDADYGVARVLAEAFPEEAGALYELYSGAYAPGGQTMLNLETAEAFARPDAPVVPPRLLR